MAFGQSSDSEPWKFWVGECPLCGDPVEMSFQQKPDTAGVRAVIADGGGVRGIVPLTFLKELETAIGLPMSIQEHFDIAFGSSSGNLSSHPLLWLPPLTSIGALSILGLFVNGWSIDECITQFKTLSNLAFSRKKYFNLPLVPFGTVRNFFGIIGALVTDSKYSSKGINTALKSAFGETSSLFGSSGGKGTKVAIVATTTDEATTCVFANYNGPETRSKDCGMPRL